MIKIFIKDSAYHRYYLLYFLLSVIYGFIMYTFTQGATVLIIFRIGLFNKGIMKIMNVTDIVN